MKKLFLVMLVLVLFMGQGVLAYASMEDGPVKKLGRGLSNVVFSPLEIISGMKHATDENGPLAGASWGIVKGLVDMGKRMVVGAYEVVTFPIPLPDGYEPIIDDPEFYLEEDPDIFQSDMPDRTMPDKQ